MTFIVRVVLTKFMDCGGMPVDQIMTAKLPPIRLLGGLWLLRYMALVGCSPTTGNASPLLRKLPLLVGMCDWVVCTGARCRDTIHLAVLHTDTLPNTSW